MLNQWNIESYREIEWNILPPLPRKHEFLAVGYNDPTKVLWFNFNGSYITLPSAINLPCTKALLKWNSQLHNAEIVEE